MSKKLDCMRSKAVAGRKKVADRKAARKLKAAYKDDIDMKMDI